MFPCSERQLQLRLQLRTARRARSWVRGTRFEAGGRGATLVGRLDALLPHTSHLVPRPYHLTLLAVCSWHSAVLRLCPVRFMFSQVQLETSQLLSAPPAA